MSFDWDYCSLHFVSQRQASLLTRRDQYGHLHPLSKTQCLLTETIVVSTLSARGKRACWHVEITLVSTLPSRDNQVYWHAVTIIVICLFTFRRRQCLQSFKGDNAFIYISKMTMSSKGIIPWPTFAFWRRQCLQSLHAFKRRQWPSFAFRRRQCL